jgi:hypothetical protein
MVKFMLHFIIALCFMFEYAYSQENGEVPIEAWVQTAKTSADYPFSLLILTSDFDDKTAPIVANLTKAEIEDTSYFQLANSASLTWDLNINSQKVANLNSREVLEKLTEARFYLFAPLSGAAIFAKRDSQGKIKKMFSLKISTPLKWDKILIQVQKKLGWDGIILEVSGNKFIVGAPTELLDEPDIQALAIAGSKDADIVAKEDRTGLGLLALVKSYKGFGVFESILVDDSKKISVGTKLIIEKRKK